MSKYVSLFSFVSIQNFIKLSKIGLLRTQYSLLNIDLQTEDLKKKLFFTYKIKPIFLCYHEYLKPRRILERNIGDCRVFAATLCKTTLILSTKGKRTLHVLPVLLCDNFNTSNMYLILFTIPFYE